MKDKLEFLKRPWAITEEAFEILAGYDLDRCEQSPLLAELDLSSFNERLKVDEESGIAILDVSGTLMPSPSLVARFFMGAVDSIRIENLVRQAARNDDVRALMIIGDSGGGAVTGVPEIGNAVAECEAKKPVFVFSNSIVASGMYWIAAPATELIGTESSRWGSVGVIRPHVDLTEARKREGIKVTLFTSGKHKGAGAMATSLSDEQSKAIKAEVERLGDKFRGHVTKYRDIERKNLEARVYYADEAIGNGYIDRIVSNFDEALTHVKESLASGEYKKPKEKTQASLSVDITTEDEPDGNSADINMPNKPDTQEEENLEEGNADDVNLESEGAVDGEGQVEGESADDPTDANDSSNDSSDAAESADDEPTAESRINALEEGQTAMNGKLDKVLAALSKGDDSTDADDDQSESVDEGDSIDEDATAREAARIAAESGVNAADVTGDGDADAEADEYANMSHDELWGEYTAILEKEGTEAANAFCSKHIAR